MRVICFLLLSCLALPAQALALLDAYALALRNDPSFQAAIAERDAGGLGQTALDAGSKVRVEHHQQQLRLRRRVPKDSSRGDVSMFGYLLGRHLGVTVLRK